MAYNLPLQLSIQAPSQANINAIVKQIEKSFSNIDIGKGVDPKSFAKVNAAIQKTNKQLDSGKKQAENFWNALEGKARSAVAYTVVNTAILKLTGTVSQATREAIKYEAELLKISQVTNQTAENIYKESKALTEISKKYNVALSKVAQLTRTLAQTGLSFKEAAKGAEILARTSLLATFDSLTSTTEGLIAVMQTFEVSVQRAGKVLESINAVSKQFAVESSDIVEAIRRTGGAFSTAGGQIEELIALFTAVRSTSRESAETIATGFRTIFGRLQRPKTIEYFKELGIQLETAEGQFIGPYQAIEEISKGLTRLGIAAGSTKFAEVVEQIGGIRQISRVVPLLQQAEKSQKALDIANNSSAESIEDLEKAQKGLGFQLGQLQKEFGALISEVVNSSSFKFLAEVFINTSKAVIGLVSALKPLLPILATVAAFKIGRGISALLSGGIKGITGGAKGFASGGMVPGSGNGDTVPAMLTPGEFVVRKSAVQAYGANNLAKINKYATGGTVVSPDSLGSSEIRKRITRKGSKTEYDDGKKINSVDNIKLKIEAADIDAPIDISDTDFEKLAAKKLGAKWYGGNYPVDAVSMAGTAIEARNRTTRTPDSELADKLARYRLKTMSEKDALGNSPTKDDINLGKLIIARNKNKMANGGAVGTDTVPALLTPGEYVINKKSAQAYGYNNLKAINKYAKGGVVQRFATGGTAKAPRTLSDEDRKRMSESYKSGDSVLSRGESTGGVLKGIAAKYEKLYAEERAIIKEIYQAKANNAIKEGKSVQEVLDEYHEVIADVKKGMQTAAKGEISSKRGDIIKKLDDASKGASDKIEKAGTTLSDTLKKNADRIKKLNISYAEAAIGVQSFASALSAFGGVNINQKELTAGQVKGGVYAGTGEAFTAANRKNVFAAGKAIESFGKKLPGVGGQVSKFGGALAKNAGTISKAAGKIGKLFNIIAWIELAGGAFASFTATDFDKSKENMIAMGNEAGAAANAAKAYAQEGWRGVPIIGSWLVGLQAGTFATEKSIDATGRLIVANARLEANLNNFDKELNVAQRNLSAAFVSNDQGKIQEAFKGQLDVIQKLEGNAKAVQTATDEIGGFNLGRILAAGGSGAAVGAGVGGVIGTVAGSISSGALGGAASGIATGGLAAIPGAIGSAAAGGAAGGKIGAGIGAVAGAIIYGAAEMYKQATTSSETIEKGYAVQTEAIKASTAAYIGAIEGFGQTLEAEVRRVVRGGGDYNQALENVSKKLGEANVANLFGEFQLTGDSAKDVEKLEEALRLLDEQLQQNTDNTVKNAGNVRAEARLAAEKASLESEKERINAIKQTVLVTQAAAESEKKLAAERAVQAAAIKKEIELRKGFQKAMDKANQAVRDISNIADEINNIGTGKLTFRQGAQKAGISVDPRVLEMSTDEILRNTDALAQMAGSIDQFAAANGLGSGPGQVVRDVQDNFNKLAQLTDPAVIAKSMTGIQQGDSTAVEEVKKNLMSQIGVGEGTNAVLEAAVQDYARAILEGGPAAAAEAEQAARDKVSKLAEEFIEQNKEKLKELAQMEQQYRDLEIELVNRRMQNAENFYNMEAEMFGKRMDLLTKVQDFLNPVAEGSGKASAIAARGQDRRAIERGGLMARRGAGFAATGMGGQTLNQAVQSFSQQVADVANAAGDVGTSFQELQGKSQMLLTTIQDEIRIEQEYLDVLIDSASAQQEYTQALNDAQGAIVRDLVTGSDEEVKRSLQTMNAAAMAAQQGSFEGIPDDMKKDIFGLFDQFANVEIPGLGITGRDAQREITKNEMMRKFGVDEATATQLASKAVQDKVPIEERMAQAIEDQKKVVLELLDKEEQVKRGMLDTEAINNQKFAEGVEQFRQGVDEFRNKIMGQGMTPQEAQAANAQVDAAKAAEEAGPLGQPIAHPEDLTQVKPAATYGLTASQQQYAQGIVNISQDREGLVAKRDAGTITEEEKKQLNRADLALSQNKTLLASSGLSPDHRDVKMYQDEYKRVQSEQAALAANQGAVNMIPGAGNAAPLANQGAVNMIPGVGNAAPNATAPNAPVAAPSGATAQNEPIQIQSQGQQEITVRLPDIQALVNQQITATVMEQVAKTFSNIANDVRGAENFDDVANAMSNGVTQQSKESIA